VLSATPGSQFKDQIYPYADKVVHVILYGTLFLLFTIGLIKQRSFLWFREHTTIKVFIGVIAYGAILEFLQGFVFEQRSIELFDMLANAGGGVCGWILFILIYGRDNYS
jgi:VanZ family protein